MSAILKFDFQKRKQLRFSEAKYLNYTKRPNFACDNYIFPKTRGNKNRQWTHSTPLNCTSMVITFIHSVCGSMALFYINYQSIYSYLAKLIIIIVMRVIESSGVSHDVDDVYSVENIVCHDTYYVMCKIPRQLLCSTLSIIGWNSISL